MIEITLSPQEAILLYGLLEGTIENVQNYDNLPLNNRELTYNLLQSIMEKIADDMENQ